MSHLTFYPQGMSKSGKTNIWTVMNGIGHLGYVSWYAPWRRYTFTPLTGTTFDGECLTEISTFVKVETHKHNGTEYP